jgi:uncharacterized membrane protein YesL
MILTALKNSVFDLWEEMFYALVFNIIWVVGTVLIIPWPFVTFGLFFTVYDVGQGKGIKLSTFFRHARRHLKPAYIWGGINLAIFIILGTNIRFYVGLAQAGAQWAVYMRLFMISLTALWVILQLIALALYPRLDEPGFKLALRNAAILVARYPTSIVALAILTGLIILISAIFPALSFLVAAAFIAIITNRIVETMVARELKRMEEDGSRE